MTLNPEQIAKILEAHTYTKGNVQATVRDMAEQGYYASVSSVKKYWKLHELPRESHGGRRVSLKGGSGALSDEEIDGLLRVYLYAKATYKNADDKFLVKETSEKTLYNSSTVRRHLRRAKLIEQKKKSKKTVDEEYLIKKFESIVGMYRHNPVRWGFLVCKTANVSSYCNKTVKKVLRQRDLIPHNHLGHYANLEGIIQKFGIK